MADVRGARPYYHPGRTPRTRTWAPLTSCPAALQETLALNNMVVDDTTSRDGNCGISAFTISIMDAMKLSNTKQQATSPEARRLGCLKRCRYAQRVTQARTEGINWLHENARRKLWEGMTVSQLVALVSGESMSTYRERMHHNGEWVDTVFLHALACAYGVTVLVFQDACDPCILGPQLHEDFDQECDVVVPMALVNDYHFWAAIPMRLPDMGCTPAACDKGELVPFRGVDDRAGEYSPADMNDEDQQEHHASWTATPGLRSAAEVDKELQFCSVLSRWCPWAEPSVETVQAVQAMAQDTHDSDVSAKCLARRRALQALAYEEACGDSLPEIMRYQKGARRHLLNPKDWRCAVKARAITWKYMAACAKLPAMNVLTEELDSQQPCSNAQTHSHVCAGIGYFSAAVVHNWRVLWYSLPAGVRRERLLKAFGDSLQQHRQQGGFVEQWRMEFRFLGHRVCQIAFLALTGISKSMIAECREGAIQGKHSFLSAQEMGLHASLRKTDGGKLPTYLSARQWLEHYASTHAEMSPMDEKAYLPSGRKLFYYYQYRSDMIERSEKVLGKRFFEESLLGSTPGQRSEPPAPSSPPPAHSAARPDRKRKHTGALKSTPRCNRDFAQEFAARAGIGMASLSTFYEAWRVECPWIVIAKSIGMFTKCSVCDYLKLLIEQCPREEHELREFLKDRIGRHFDFQAAQRLSHAREEEAAAQSGGEHWLVLIDKMDQRKTVVPSIWSQLRTPLFKELDKRLISGLIGCMWFGTDRTHQHVRTVFDDCSHGAEMQSSALLLNLHEVAMKEGHLPKRWTIGADNTRKETKNQTTMWMLVWLLCALADTPLWTIDVIFLLVGHTHNKLDRFFSRLAVALAGRDYFTVVGMLRIMVRSLSCDVDTAHLSQVWGWKELQENQYVSKLHNLDPVHAFRYYRSGGIYMQWKQWCTDEDWCRPVLLVPEENIHALASFRPPCLDMEFAERTEMEAWINRFEIWCSSQPVGEYKNLDAEFRWLREILHHQVPGEYSPGKTVGAVLQDLRALPHLRPQGPRAPGNLQSDTITQLFPGADIPPIPAENLVRIDGITHTANGRVIRSNVIVPGSFLLVRVSDDTIVHGTPLGFLVAVAVETNARLSRDHQTVVVWYVPGMTPVENFRQGKKRNILDIFGTWTHFHKLTSKELNKCNLPQPVVALSQILECDFELSEEGTLPYDVFDLLRTQHSIDVTGFHTSMTHKGNLYRNYILHRGNV